jgi:hypothetical protein
MSKTFSEERKAIRPSPPVAINLPLTIQFCPRLGGGGAIFSRLNLEGRFEMIAQ